LARLASVQPLVLVADDLHWADGATLELLRRLAGTAPEARMLVVVVLRSPGEEISSQLADALGDFSRLDAVTRISLGDLTSDDVRAFIRASTDAEAVTELVSEIGELTNGTPLLLCELWRDLRETGGVEVSHTVQLTRPFAELRGSEPIRDFMRQRLSRLSPETKALVELAAVAGSRVELGVLCEASGLERARLVPLLDRAAAAGLLEALPEPELASRFTHELVRRAVYDRLEGAPRAELHLRVGEALERTYASEPTRVLPELAHHFTLAASVAGVERAVDYNLRAATTFAATAAYDLAQARLATALELGIADRRDRARVQQQLAYILRELGRHEDAAPILAASVDAAAELGERGVATITVIDGIQAMGDPRVDPEQARSTVEHAIETLEELGDPGDLAHATRWLGLVLRRQGRLAEARAVLERALEHANAAGNQDTRRRTIGSLLNALTDGPEPVDVALRRCEELRREYGRDPALAAVITCFTSALLAMAGHFDAAIAEDAAAATASLDKSGHTTSFWLYQVTAVVNTKELLGDRAGAQRELAARSNWFRKQGSHKPDARAMASAYRLALMYCDDGRWDDAEHWLTYGSEVPVPAYFLLEAVIGLAARARVAAHRGAPGDAVTLARRAVELMDVSDHLNHRALIWLALAEVERANGDPAKADAAVATARALYEQKGNVAAAALI
jgi:tetratricopeptide (TPR) repeat protein